MPAVYRHGVAPKLTKRFEKNTNYSTPASSRLSRCICIFPRRKPVEPEYLVVALCRSFGGASNGFQAVLQSIMMTRSTTRSTSASARRHFLRGPDLIGKLCNGIAVIISGIAYKIVGLTDSNIQELNEFIAGGGIPRISDKYQTYMAVLFFLVSIPPAVGGILSVIPTWNYALRNDEHKKALAALNERRHAQQTDSQGD